MSEKLNDYYGSPCEKETCIHWTKDNENDGL